MIMNTPDRREQIWKQRFPSLFLHSDGHIKELINKSRLLAVPAKQKVLLPGSSCKDYLLVAEGHLRVQFITKSGREVVLYHVNPGDDCVLTTSCLFGGDSFPAEGISETELIVIAIPVKDFHAALQQCSSFRQFVFSTFGKRLTSVISRIETLCTSSIEFQLVKALLYLGKAQSLIDITHQELASEVGTVREVVSRHLKKFERNGWIKLGRGNIELLDREGLGTLLVK